MAPPDPIPPPSELRGKVLYVEDDPINMVLVESTLQAFPGITMIKAATGAEGIRLARTEWPDLVILDMHLPDMGGADVLQALRGDESTRGVRVIALSASAMPEDIALARRHGACDYWTKPLDFTRFLNDIGTLLGRNCVCAAPPAPPQPRPEVVAGSAGSCASSSR